MSVPGVRVTEACKHCLISSSNCGISRSSQCVNTDYSGEDSDVTDNHTTRHCCRPRPVIVFHCFKPHAFPLLLQLVCLVLKMYMFIWPKTCGFKFASLRSYELGPDICIKPERRTINLLDALQVVHGQFEVVSVHVLVERSHDGRGIIGVLEAQSVTELVDRYQEQIVT